MISIAKAIFKIKNQEVSGNKSPPNALWALSHSFEKRQLSCVFNASQTPITVTQN